MGKSVCVLLDEGHEKNRVIPGQELIWREEEPPAVSSVFICLDCGSAERLGKSQKAMRMSNVTVCIDHHISHEKDFTKYTCLEPNATSTCELVYKLIKPTGLMDKDIASAIYAGMLTDTGGFRHPSVTSETMKIAADLLAYEIPFTELCNELLRRHSLIETLVFRGALNNLQMIEKGKVSLATMNAKEMAEVEGRARDTDGIAEYMLGIRGVEASIFLYEKAEGEVKISMRSNNINISKIAQSFGGGGHIYAAGASARGEINEIARRISAEIISAINGERQ